MLEAQVQAQRLVDLQHDRIRGDAREGSVARNSGQPACSDPGLWAARTLTAPRNDPIAERGEAARMPSLPT